MLPTIDGRGFLLLDVGANMDAKPNQILQYALMGNIYMSMVRKIKTPRVGLVNVGSEAIVAADMALAGITESVGAVKERV